MPKHLISIYLFIMLVFSGCLTYYDKQANLQSLITQGKFTEADKVLNNLPKAESNKNRVLYYFDRGVTNFMTGNYTMSNFFFQKADQYIETYTSKAATEALAMISNPMIKPYRPEDFESVMIHYYMSLNYLFLNNYEAALVECRRLNIQLSRLNNRYTNNKNKYSEDAFAHNLMGIIYDASGDYNNAFIAYRNAISTYESVNIPLWNQEIPKQLQLDVIKMAKKMGFHDQVDFFQNKFAITYTDSINDNGSLVFFWMNGFGPVKSQWSINFVNNGYNNGWVTLANDAEDLYFPIYISEYSQIQQSAFQNLSALRIAFPKYQTREPLFKSASLQVNGDSTLYALELAEDINKIAYQCLKDRMVREFTNSIARLAVKKAVEELVRSQDENLGSIVSILNAVTEKADTRNWQSLPYSISYSRISLPAGQHKVSLKPIHDESAAVAFDLKIESNKTTFYAYHHLESYQLNR